MAVQGRREKALDLDQGLPERDNGGVWAGSKGEKVEEWGKKGVRGLIQV